MYLYPTGPGQVPIRQDEDFLPRRAGGLPREATIRPTACLRHHDTEDGAWLARQETLRENTEVRQAGADLRARDDCPKVRVYYVSYS